MTDREVLPLIEAKRSKFFYGWVVVGAGILIMVVQSTILYSFGVFFKPLAADFGWNRATTSGVQSLLLIFMGVFSIAVGWLADRVGPAKILGICGFLAGLGLIFTSQINSLLQIYLTYSLIGIGVSSTFPVAGTITARWFIERRGLALGIVTSGMGLGAVVGVPIVASLITWIGWSKAYFALGICAFIIYLSGAFLLRRSPDNIEMTHKDDKGVATKQNHKKTMRTDIGRTVTLANALRTKTLWMLVSIFSTFSFCNWLVNVHIVNYVTDLGITPLVAVTMVSVIGFSGIAGRLLMGTVSDRIGNINTMVIACLGLASGLIGLILARELWMFYLFAIAFGFSFGAEIPQQPALVGKYFGLQAALVGLCSGGNALGGALGSWLAGKVFDMTQSYLVAFIIGAMTSVFALALTILLRKRRTH